MFRNLKSVTINTVTIIQKNHLGGQNLYRILDPSKKHRHWKNKKCIYFVVISLDGFRWDYLNRYNLSNFNILAERGVRAKWMKSAFDAVFSEGRDFCTKCGPLIIVSNNEFHTILKLSNLEIREHSSFSNVWKNSNAWRTRMLKELEKLEKTRMLEKNSRNLKKLEKLEKTWMLEKNSNAWKNSKNLKKLECWRLQIVSIKYQLTKLLKTFPININKN